LSKKSILTTLNKEKVLVNKKILHDKLKIYN